MSYIVNNTEIEITETACGYRVTQLAHERYYGMGVYDSIEEAVNAVYAYAEMYGHTVTEA